MSYKDHILVAIKELQDVRKILEGEIIQVDSAIASLISIGGQKSVPIPAQTPPKKKAQKNSWNKPPNNSGPISLRVREIMNDGKARHLHEVLQYFGTGEIDPKSKLYESVNNALNKLYRSKLLVRISRGVYRRSLKGIKQPQVSMVEPNSTKKLGAKPDPNSLRSKIIGAVATETEFNAAYLNNGPLKKVLEEKYPDDKPFERASRVSGMLSNLATHGKLIKVRPGVFIKPASLK